MRILITGASGQLGEELQRQLREKKSVLGAVPAVFLGAAVTAVDVDRLDITDDKSVDAFFKRGFDLVFNCAAMTDVDGCERDEERAFLINAEAAGNLARAAAETGARLCHLSTDYVFSGAEEKPRTEADTPAPATAYGRSKLRGEELVLSLAEDALIVRTAWLYGVQGKNFVKTIRRAGREGPLKVVDDQYGCPTSAVDLAHHLLLLGASKERGLFHCVNHGICTWYDFAKTILELSRIETAITPCTTEDYPRPAKRPHFSALENRRLAETVGDRMRSWQDAVRDYLLHDLPQLESDLP